MRFISSAEDKARAMRRILTALPDWFGIPEAIDEYVEQARSLPCCVYEEEGNIIGIVALRKTSDCAAEVHVMGVLQGAHRRGIGRALIDACLAWCRQQGLSLLHVKTLDDGVGHPSYLKTYAFYRAMGFMPLEVLPLWDALNPCLLMVRAV